MISNPRFIVGRKVKSRCQQIIRAIFIFLTPSQQSTVNSQQSRTVQPESISLLDAASPFSRGNRGGFAPRKRTCVEALLPCVTMHGITDAASKLENALV